MPGPPPPPPPPAAAFKPPPATKGRGDLLKSIEGFKKGGLKKAETVDKSGPAIVAPKPGGGGAIGGGAPTVSAGRAGPGAPAGGGGGPNLGGLTGGIFAGGVPRLRKTGLPGSSSIVGEESPAPAATPIPKLAPVVAAPAPSKPAPSPISRPPPSTPNKFEPPKPSPVAESKPVLKQPPPTPAKNLSSLNQSGGASDAMAVAIYPFSAIRPNDLTIEPGDIILRINKNPPGSGNGNWWEGTLNGKSGHFPANYVEVITQFFNIFVFLFFFLVIKGFLPLNPNFLQLFFLVDY